MSVNHENRNGATSDKLQDVQVDSAHPRFRKRYHCPDCNQKFEASLEGLQRHFLTKFHKDADCCRQCGSAIFIYKDTSKEQQYYSPCDCTVKPEETNDKSNVEPTVCISIDK